MRLLSPSKANTIADLLEQLGDISPHRVRMNPLPGRATEKDLLRINAREGRLFELVDRVLVEKAMGYAESILAVWLASQLENWVGPRNLGLVVGPDGTIRLFEGTVRMADVAFISWDRIPGRRVPKEPIPFLAPDLAVEILSKSNTRKEMARKRREYFKVGVTLVWEVDPKKRNVAVYTTPEKFITLEDTQNLTGDPVLPGFSLSLAELFAVLDRQGPKSK